MIKVENVKVYNLTRAVYSARNAMNSWALSDSDLENDVPGERDLELAKKLFKAGPSHRKFLRQIFVTMDIVAPRYWWTEADTYKIGTVSNSCSTMHRIHEKPFTMSDFSFEHCENDTAMTQVMSQVIDRLNKARDFYNETKDKEYWWYMIQTLPQSYNQRRTLTMNYENVISMIEQRSNHKLDEWRDFCGILQELPYLKQFMGT